ncbi:hypothetical protein ABL78_3397 [Leptomonas seymouri]|uniref:Myotubularin phosphatase domain-containing protein n=1 Tax=Leptomonas seymouri TaxID=5684 RepID=A0A0N0P6E0_LEPSE|nr:hypothetical protein ABL78_3397 [Leptomonas seymouri]|eukprot:KPI87519.1 hypothetical protein ABL78_3397 [Leptomonas seymouri]
MILQAASALAPACGCSGYTPAAPSAMTPQHTGGIAVPHIDDTVVLLVLDFSVGVEHHQPAGAVNPWWHLNNVGLPCLLVVPAAPLEMSPASPPLLHSPRATNDEDPQEDNPESFDKGEDEAKEGPAGAPSHAVPSSAADAVAVSDDVFYVCVQETAAPPAAALATTTVDITASERWFQVLLPRPFSADDLRQLLHADAYTEKGVEEEGGSRIGSRSDSSHPCRFHVVCRDVWPLPPASPPQPTAPESAAHHAPTTPLVESYPPLKSHEPWSGKYARLHGAGHGEGDSDAAVRDSPPRIWAAVSSHLQHLSSWNRDLWAYLLDSANHVGEAWLPPDTAVAALGTDCITAPAAPAVSPARPPVLRLLRLIFWFWQRLLQVPEGGFLTPPVRSSHCEDIGDYPLRSSKPTPLPVTARPVPLVEPETEQGSTHLPSPLLRTPAQISRVFFHNSRHTRELLPKTPDGEPAYSAVPEESAAPPPTLATALRRRKADTPAELSLASAATTTTRPDYHLTAVAMVEQLLLSIDFTLAYQQGDVSCLSPTDSSAEHQPPPRDAPALSSTASFAEIWASYLVRRMLRATAISLAEPSAAPPRNSRVSSHVKSKREPIYDLYCTALDIWLEWVRVTVETAAATVAPTAASGYRNRTAIDAESTSAAAAVHGPRHIHPDSSPLAFPISCPSSLPSERSTSHVNFSVPGMQRPHSVGAAAEAVEQPATRHRRGSTSTPLTRTASADVNNPPSRDRKSGASSVSSASAGRAAESAVRASAAAFAAEILQTIPCFRAGPVKWKAASETATHRDGRRNPHAATTGMLSAHATVPVPPSSVSFRDAVRRGSAERAASDRSSPLDSASCTLSRVPSVTNTVLPRRPISAGGGRARGGGVSEGSHDASRAHSADSTQKQTAPSLVYAYWSQAASPPPRQMDSSEIRLSSIEEGAQELEKEGGKSDRARAVQSQLSQASTAVHVAPAIRPGTAALLTAPHARSAVVSSANTALSSSSSMIASEYRLFPFTDDGVEHSPTKEVHDVVDPAGTASTSCETATPTADASRTHFTAPCSPPAAHRRRGGIYSAASFTTVLSELLTQVLAVNASARSSSAFPLNSAVRVEDVAVAQRQLELIHRGQVFPSLTTLDTLNMLPYYVHVWCYTYDPLTQKQRRLGAEAVSSSGGGGGSGAHMQSYLQHYESGTSATYRVGGGALGGGAASISPQMLRNLMMEGTRALWRGVKAAAQRGVQDAVAFAGDAAANASSGTRDRRSKLSQAFAMCSASSSPQPANRVATAVYGSSGGGGRDMAKDPTLYNAVCGLYITEQDIIIRSLPTEEVRKRRVQARQRQRLRRQEQRQQQGGTARAEPSSYLGGSYEDAASAPQLRRPYSVMDMSDKRTVHQQRRLHARERLTAAVTESDAEGEEEDGDDVEEAELLLLPRVGLLSVTACTVSRSSGGVFSEKYAHKLFLHQEDQVMALRAQQQQQRRQHRHGLRAAASSGGLAEITPSSCSLRPRPQQVPISATRIRDSCDGAARNAAATTTPIRTHTTLRPFIEDMLHRQQARTMAHAASSSSLHGASVIPKESSCSTSPPIASGAALHFGSRRQGVTGYFSALLRATSAHREHRETRSHTQGGGGGGGGVVEGILTHDNIEAAAAAAAVTDGGSTCSATAAAFAAAASVMSATTAASSQPAVVLKLESKSMPTVWLEFADAATLMYVYHLLETPLRSSSVSCAGARVTSVDATAWEAAPAPATSSGKTDGRSCPPRSPSTAFIHPPSTAPSAPTTAVPLPSALPCFGNRFLSSARRHWSMVPLVLVAAKALPHGSAPSPFLLALLKNVSAAMTLLHLAPTTASTVLLDDCHNSERWAADETRPPAPAWRPASRQEAHAAPSPAPASLSLADTWWLYDPAREFGRQGLSPDRWTLTNVNNRFAFCPTYPSRFVVPSAVAEAMELGELNGQHRLSQRVEAVCFRYAPTGGVLVRSAQPAIARLFVNSATPALEVASIMAGGRLTGGADSAAASSASCPVLAARGGGGERLRRAAPSAALPPASPPSAIPLMDAPFLILNAFAAAAGVTAQQLVVMDLRTVTAAYANMMRGGGTMDMLLYPFGGVEYAGLPNIHDVRHAWLRLRQSLMEAPYQLNGDGGARRETRYVLRGGEPPYAAVVAAAERSAVTARPVQSLAPPLLPSSQQPQQPHHSPPPQQDPRALPSSSSAATAAQRTEEPIVAGESEGGERIKSSQQPDENVDMDEDNLRQPARCLDVVQQATIAARSGSDHRHEHHADDDIDGYAGAADKARFKQKGSSSTVRAAASTFLHFPFSFGSGTGSGNSSSGGNGGGGGGGDGGLSPRSSPSAAATMLASRRNAAASEVTSPPQQEWLRLLAGLLNTSVVVARRVCGVPTDPLYVPAMEHNGAMANCFSYIVGHAFTRFWLPVSSRNGPGRQRSRGGGAPTPAWWARRTELRGAAAAPHPHFDATVASFAPSAHRTLAQVVFLNCSDGWDRTTQVSVVAQLLLDPYYRTVEGLCILLEKELLCFGHPSQKRSTAVRGNTSGGWEVEAEMKAVSTPAAAAAVSTLKKEEARGAEAHASSSSSSRTRPPTCSAREQGHATTPGAASPTPATAPLQATPTGPSEAIRGVEDAEADVVSEEDFEVWLSDSDDATALLHSGTAASGQGSVGEVESAPTSAGADSGGGGHTAAAPANTCLRDASPIALQLLDAIYQLVRLYPACFEFTEQFVLLLMDLLHCGLLSTFAVNSEQQAEQEGAAKGSMSLSQWCALLLSTRVSPIAATPAASSAATPTAVTTAEDPSSSLSPISVSPVKPVSPAPAAHTEAQGKPVLSPAETASGGVAEMSVKTHFSSVDASFQCLNSQLLARADEAGELERSTGSGIAPWIPSLSLSTTPSGARRSDNGDEGFDAPPTQPMLSACHAEASTSPPTQQPEQPLARAVYMFDCSTRWQDDSGAATTHATRRAGSSPPSPAQAMTNVEGQDGFRRRLLPVSLDALYSSGYLNTEFSLKHNRMNVGPLVDFILPSQLVLWRSAYARHSFWNSRTYQLQHSVGPINLYGAGSQGGAPPSGATTSPESSSTGPCGGALGGHRLASLSQMERPADGAAADARSQQRRVFGSTSNEGHNGLVGTDLTARNTFDSDRCGGLGAAPPSYVPPPGMMNFHIGSGSDEENDGVEAHVNL